MDPDLSLAVPLYDEAPNVERVSQGLLAALEEVSLELILVDNGSRDGTGATIDALAQRDPRIRKVRVEVNQGYGRGVREGLALARGAWVGWMGGDGQIDPHDVRRLWERARASEAQLVKVARTKRHDGTQRVLVSSVYNWLFRRLFGTVSHDINGTPKFLRRELYMALGLRSDDWFLDAEAMIGAHRRGAQMIELPVEFLVRPAGRSKVRPRTIMEFLWNMARAKKS